MIRSQLKPSFAWFPLVIASLLRIPATGQIEDPDFYPDSWYRIAVNAAGELVEGDGYGYNGGTWYYYPETGWYRQWFYNGPYDPERKGELAYQAYITPGPSIGPTDIELRFNWTTPAWSALGLDRPPLPGDAPTAGDEATYMSSEHFHSTGSVSGFTSIEPNRDITVDAYNPEWISIDVRGRNFRVYRWAIHQCLPKTAEKGAWCNRATGECYMGYPSDGTWPYTWLGAGSSCDDCTKPADLLDFGDAPDPTYPTMLASNGARHTIVAGVFLGRGVDAETNGQPNLSATGDDNIGGDEDGVVFASPLQAGRLASVDVTASVAGYLSAWIDFNGDGSFDGADEEIFGDELLAAGLNQLVFEVPTGAVLGATFARFRFNTRGLLSYDGPASDGEVEDYRVTILKGLEPHPTSGLTAAQWDQPPSLVDQADPYHFDGFTVLSAFDRHEIVADDCQFADANPVTGIHWWGSFKGWSQSHLPPELPLAFHIGIWSDVPDLQPGNPDTFNHPGTLLWETYSTIWTWALAGSQQDIKGGSQGDTCFQFSLSLSQDEWFFPTTGVADGSPESTFYWVSIAAIYDLKDEQPEHPWGWLSRVHQSSAAATVIQEITPVDLSPWPPMPGAQWHLGTLVQNDAKLPWDMAFQLTTYQSPYATGSAEEGPDSEGKVDLPEDTVRATEAPEKSR